MSFINNVWYGKTLTSLVCQLPLMPFSWIFGFVAATRRSMYSHGLLNTVGPVVPVVIVGGITAGGTGKTPLCIALVNELKARGFNPGVLSRGYKSQCKTHPCQVPYDGSPEVYGDEPCLIRRETLAPVVIDPKRVRGADYLVSLGVDVIISDDGMQHYALDRDIEICVLDGSRMLGNECLLPAGPLREAKWRLKTVDSVVITGAVANLGCAPMMLRPSGVYAINPESQEVLENKTRVCALAGIGNPARFYKSLEDYGFTLGQVVHVGDHEKVSIDKIKKYASQMPVIMTAKDAIKYGQDARELSNVFVFKVQASLSKQFFDGIASKISQSKYRVKQRKERREAQGYKLESNELIEQELIASLESKRKVEQEQAAAQLVPTKSQISSHKFDQASHVKSAIDTNDWASPDNVYVASNNDKTTAKANIWVGAQVDEVEASFQGSTRDLDSEEQGEDSISKQEATNLVKNLAKEQRESQSSLSSNNDEELRAKRAAQWIEERPAKKSLSELQGITTAQGNSWFASGSEHLVEKQKDNAPPTETASFDGLKRSTKQSKVDKLKSAKNVTSLVESADSKQEESLVSAESAEAIESLETKVKSKRKVKTAGQGQDQDLESKASSGDVLKSAQNEVKSQSGLTVDNSDNSDYVVLKDSDKEDSKEDDKSSLAKKPKVTKPRTRASSTSKDKPIFAGPKSSLSSYDPNELPQVLKRKVNRDRQITK